MLCDNFSLAILRKRELLAILTVILDFSLTVKAATLIFISGCGSATSSFRFFYNLVNS